MRWFSALDQKVPGAGKHKVQITKYEIPAKRMRKQQTKWIAFALLLLTAFSFRLYVARYLANDSPGDGKVYARMARNLLEQHVYSHDEEPPYTPSIIRLPGYPLFLAAIYSVFGHENNTAVRAIQALIDTTTCGLVALLAYLWEPEQRRKWTTALFALTLAAICPFTAIYVGTILTETWASFFAVALCLLTTFAFRARSFKQSLWRWAMVGLWGSASLFFRPDSGLFMAAVGLTLVSTIVSRPNLQISDAFEEQAHWKNGWLPRLRRVIAQGAVLSLAFVLPLIPWTIRNWRTFHLFQPLSPAHGEMPGEFVPRGYQQWVRTWIDDGRYIEIVLWTLDDKPIDADDLPDSAFDSPEEKTRVTRLFDQYNHPPETVEPTAPEEASPSPSPTPASKLDQTLKPGPGPAPPANDKPAEDENDDEETEEPEEPEEPETPEMTAAIDAEFGQIARERIARAPLRYYVWLPIKRGWSLWVGPHADYYPFSGELLPLEDLDHGIHQHLWLPLFTFLVVLYSLLGLAGAWFLWSAAQAESHRWLLLVTLMILIRLAFFATIENPEPRYTVEFFPLLAVLGGIGIARLRKVRQT
jgi:hypothetical protein